MWKIVVIYKDTEKSLLYSYRYRLCDVYYTAFIICLIVWSLQRDFNEACWWKWWKAMAVVSLISLNLLYNRDELKGLGQDKPPF